ncbi:MAG: Gfo/Idh/MocA family oxidoreductase [candidate division Zixibacteria bacterium]|nr:Gfo/Idh/MocA family oxidoreductase [candidate division Zixibacteria bacterium]
MKEKYRVAIAGCGGMGRSHARAWSSKPRTQVVAAMDVNRETAEKLALDYGATAYTNYNEMFAREKPDIVSVTTWQSVRAEVTLAAAAAGVGGILGEKPMSASVGEAQAMLEACERHGVKLAIGHQRRFDTQNVEARRLIADGAIGQPGAMLRRDGEGLLNRGTHEIDEMRYVVGDPMPLWVIGQVSRKTDRWERRVRCEDRCAAIVCFEGGIRGTYESDLPEPGLRGDIVYGSDGILKRGPDKTLLLLNEKKAGWQHLVPPPVGTDQFEEFIDWMDGRIEEHRSSGRHGKVTMEVLMAIYESLRIQDVVTMPLTTGPNPLDLLVEEGILPVRVPGRYDIRAPFPEQTETSPVKPVPVWPPPQA